jgi:NADPH-dependent 2,4-dienoyl-CoA reductase/sulfur reductase-like enzyme
LLAIGVSPNSRLAEEMGIELAARGAIAIDEHLRTNMPYIYAAGDCAETLYLVTGKKVYIRLGTTANKQGRVARDNTAGLISIVTKIFDIEVARTGLTTLEAAREGYGYFSSTLQGWSRSRAYRGGRPITKR